MENKHYEDQLQDHELRIRALEKTTSILEKMDYRMSQVESAVHNIDKKLDNATNTKINKMENRIKFVVESILAILIGYVAIKLGLK